MGLFDFMKKERKELIVNPDRGCSYVVDDNGEPLVVYYRRNSSLFVSTPIGDENAGYFLNIRRPVIMDVDNVAPLHIPPFPDGCDGFIFLNYGAKKAKAFLVRDPDSQVMQIPLN